MNHVPHFPYHVTGIVDTLPIYVPSSHSFSMRRFLFQPKYDDTVYKMQLGISLLGDIILWTGPHLGVTSDKTIWESTAAQHPFYSWEVWLADLGYVGCLGLLYKFKKMAWRVGLPPPPDLTQRQQFFNNLHEFYRNRVVSTLPPKHYSQLFAL